MVQIISGCRDCKKCTNSGIANAGRNSARKTIAIFSLGMSEMFMWGTRNCRVCSHKLSLHTAVDYVQPAQPAPVYYQQPVQQALPQVLSGQPVLASGPPAGWYADPDGSGSSRWWDGLKWTEHLQ